MVTSLDSEIGAADWHVREVFAAFGLAIYESNCLEQGLQILLLTAWSDRALTGRGYTVSLESLSRRTFGQLLLLAKSRPNSDATLIGLLESALETRNRLAHRYFEEHAAAFMFADGQERMRTELHDTAERLQALHSSISLLVRRWGQERGVGEQDYDQAERDLLHEYLQQQ